MVCCNDDSSIRTEAGRLLNRLRSMMVSWWGKLQSVLKLKSTERESQESVLPASSTSITTPHHVPFHGADYTGFGTVGSEGLKWQRLFKTDKDDDVELQIIDTNSAKAVITSDVKKSTSVLRPADLWKNDQARMLQGKYNFDPSFSMRYRLKQLLGEGSFGFVCVAERVRDQKEVL